MLTNSPHWQTDIRTNWQKCPIAVSAHKWSSALDTHNQGQECRVAPHVPNSSQYQTLIRTSWQECQNSTWCLAAQLCPILCNPMDCSTPGLPVHHHLLESNPNSCPLSRWRHPTISFSVLPFSSRLQSFPASGSFQVSQFFASDGQRIGVSASASVLPMNIQDRFPLRWTGLISLLSKGLTRVFSNTTVWKH